MQQQNTEFKALKKAYKRAKRAHIGAWKCLGILLILLAAAGGILAVAPEQYVGIATSFLLLYGVDGRILSFGAAVCAVAALLCVIGCAVQKKRLKQTVHYLNYRSMRNYLKAQKEMLK